MLRRALAAIGISLFALLTVTGCSTANNNASSTATVVIPKDAVLIDVRTPEEYNSGHLMNAVNYDFENGQVFTDAMNSLDKNGKYYLYCRSGNRSSQAKTVMETAGFKNVVDLGGYEKASADTGLEIVK